MIYCVEDDNSIRELVVYTLQNTGLEAIGFADGKTFFQGMEQNKPELILLDIMLPDQDGLQILKTLKGDTNTQEIPVIMVTAKGTEYDKVKGLDAGADDYIAKPFGMMELLSRVKAVLRRVQPKKSTDIIQACGITINLARHQVLTKEGEVKLTLKEFQLLYYLMENAGIVLTRDQVLSRIWGYDFDGETRTVDVHIRTLRAKLGKAGDAIETIRGVGYRLEEQT